MVRPSNPFRHECQDWGAGAALVQKSASFVQKWGPRKDTNFGTGTLAMFAILGLGFLLGMQHALEADHVAAVSSIAARRDNVADIVKHGLTWGLGHTLTLFVFAGAALALGHAISDNLSRPIETAVGV